MKTVIILFFKTYLIKLFFATINIIKINHLKTFENEQNTHDLMLMPCDVASDLERHHSLMHSTGWVVDNVIMIYVTSHPSYAVWFIIGSALCSASRITCPWHHPVSVSSFWDDLWPLQMGHQYKAYITPKAPPPCTHRATFHLLCFDIHKWGQHRDCLRPSSLKRNKIIELVNTPLCYAWFSSKSQ